MRNPVKERKALAEMTADLDKLSAYEVTQILEDLKTLRSQEWKLFSGRLAGTEIVVRQPLPINMVIRTALDHLEERFLFRNDVIVHPTMRAA